MSFVIIAVLIIAAGQSSLYAQDKGDSTESFQSANRIVGAWETTVIPRNCETGEPIAPPFQGVITFNEGGTIAEFGTNPATPYRTPGHGIWASLGGNNFLMRFSFIPLTPAGVAIGRLRVSQNIELRRFSDDLSTTGSFILTNFSGVVIGTGCSTSTAVRLTF